MTDWVSYMTGSTKTGRIEWIKSLNFGGTTDWAIDLAEWATGTAPGSSEDDTEFQDALIPCDSFEWPDTLEKLENSADLPPRCHEEALVKILLADLTSALADYRTVSEDYDDKVCDMIQESFWLLPLLLKIADHGCSLAGTSTG